MYGVRAPVAWLMDSWPSSSLCHLRTACSVSLGKVIFPTLLRERQMNIRDPPGTKLFTTSPHHRYRGNIPKAFFFSPLALTRFVECHDQFWPVRSLCTWGGGGAFEALCIFISWFHCTKVKNLQISRIFFFCLPPCDSSSHAPLVLPVSLRVTFDGATPFSLHVEWGWICSRKISTTYKTGKGEGERTGTLFEMAPSLQLILPVGQLFVYSPPTHLKKQKNQFFTQTSTAFAFLNFSAYICGSMPQRLLWNMWTKGTRILLLGSF